MPRDESSQVTVRGRGCSGVGTAGFFVSVAFKGFSGDASGLDAMDLGAMGWAPNGLAREWARVGFNVPTGPGQAPCTEFAEKDGDTPPRVFSARVANAGLMLYAASRIVTERDTGIVAFGASGQTSGRRRVPSGSVGAKARGALNAPTGPGQAPCTEVAEARCIEKDRIPPTPGYPESCEVSV